MSLLPAAGVPAAMSRRQRALGRPTAPRSSRRTFPRPGTESCCEPPTEVEGAPQEAAGPGRAATALRRSTCTCRKRSIIAKGIS